MARRPASGRGWTDDGRATGKSFRHPLEAWWKHKGENRCAILTIRAQAGLGDRLRNWRKPRKNSGYYAIVHVLFDTTHNLKAAGSNPAPATSFSRYNKRLEPDVNRRAFGVPTYINATSTPSQKNRTSTLKLAIAGGSRQSATPPPCTPRSRTACSADNQRCPKACSPMSPFHPSNPWNRCFLHFTLLYNRISAIVC